MSDRRMIGLSVLSAVDAHQQGWYRSYRRIVDQSGLESRRTDILYFAAFVVDSGIVEQVSWHRNYRRMVCPE